MRINPAGGGSESLKMDFQLGVDKEDLNDDIIILILNTNRTKKRLDG